MSEEITKIVLKLCTTQTNIQMIVLKRVFGYKRVLVSFVLSSFLTLVIALIAKQDPKILPLVIFSGLLALLFLCFLVLLRLRWPVLSAQINSNIGKDGKAVFETTKFSVKIGGEQYQSFKYKDIRGQYWFDDYYLLYIDSKQKKMLINVYLGENNFDEVFMVADALSRRKINLIRLKTKRKK